MNKVTMVTLVASGITLGALNAQVERLHDAVMVLEAKVKQLENKE